MINFLNLKSNFLVPVKVEADPNGRFVFYGGDSFGCLESRRGWLTNEGVIHYNRRNLNTSNFIFKFFRFEHNKVPS